MTIQENSLENLEREEFIRACKDKDEDKARALARTLVSKKGSVDTLRCAATYGLINLAKDMLQSGLGDLDKDQALSDAAYAGHLDIVELLIPLSNPDYERSQALYEAFNEGYTDIIKRLIPVSDCAARGSNFLWMAVSLGDKEIVGLLLPKCNPKDHKSQALQRAAFLCGNMNKGHDIFEMTYPVSDPQAALGAIWDQKNVGYLKAVQFLETRIKTDDDKKAISDAVKDKISARKRTTKL